MPPRGVVLMLFGALEALVGIVLWLLPDMSAEAILNRLGRLGYPVGGVIRYRENAITLLNERAIGTWVDPNGYGGFLLMIGAVIAPQLFAEKPVTKRWIAAGGGLSCWRCFSPIRAARCSRSRRRLRSSRHCVIAACC
jgi:hypothetical protein